MKRLTEGSALASEKFVSSRQAGKPTARPGINPVRNLPPHLSSPKTQTLRSPASSFSLVEKIQMSRVAGVKCRKFGRRVHCRRAASHLHHAFPLARLYIFHLLHRRLTEQLDGSKSPVLIFTNIKREGHGSLQQQKNASQGFVRGQGLLCPLTFLPLSILFTCSSSSSASSSPPPSFFSTSKSLRPRTMGDLVPFRPCGHPTRPVCQR